MNRDPLTELPSTAIVALGGNVGDVLTTFQRAAELLAPQATSSVRFSRLYRSMPMGADAGATFFNAAIAFESRLAPESLLDRLQEVESQLGRIRTIHWGPRTLDLDLIAYGNRVMSTPRLTLPHPHCWYRRFVLDPVCDIAGDQRHAQFNVSFSVLRERLLLRPLVIAVDMNRLAPAISARLKSEFPSVVFVPLAAASTATIAIHFETAESSANDFPVMCPNRADPEQFVRDVLTAATDQLLAEDYATGAISQSREVTAPQHQA